MCGCVILVCKNVIDEEVHQEVNPEYLTKLEEIRTHKGVRFTNVGEFEVYFRVS
ncbi:MAG: hypothetical protein KAT05_02915 [Spirochaetes bacterium]|nr:hypothetical protein [Spirochaetota bacterium]